MALPSSLSAERDLSADLDKRLKFREGVPGIVALKIEGGKVVAKGAAGIRKLGDETKVEVEDKFHLGSCTKAMTATLAAVLVEKGKIKWDSTIGDILKEKWVHEEYRGVTLTQLLSHTGGCPKSPPGPLWLELTLSPKTKPMKQRVKLAKGVLSEKPSYKPGTGYEYSNTGYAIAGIMLERVGGDPWEKLMEEEIFEPLKMTSAGFRAPASGRRRTDQPWGHKLGIAIPPEPEGDNPDAIGPAEKFRKMRCDSTFMA